MRSGGGDFWMGRIFGMLLRSDVDVVACRRGEVGV